MRNIHDLQVTRIDSCGLGKGLDLCGWPHENWLDQVLFSRLNRSDQGGLLAGMATAVGIGSNLLHFASSRSYCRVVASYPLQKSD